jgi:hypothetical protein
MLLRWVVVVAISYLIYRTATLTAFCYWAAGFPPTPNQAYYRFWGNVYFAVTLVLTGAMVALVVSIVRKAKGRHAKE